MSHRRTVRVTQPFFDQLDELLPATRTASGRPSTTDFLLHEMTTVIDKLADDFDRWTSSTPAEMNIRTPGRMVTTRIYRRLWPTGCGRSAWPRRELLRHGPPELVELVDRPPAAD